MNLDRDYIFLKFTAAAAAWTKFSTSTAHVDCLIDAIRAWATRADGGAARAYYL